MYDYIFTIGCFDRLHKGHIKLLDHMVSNCKKLVIGIHDNASIKTIKNITNVQELSVRKNNLKNYAFDIFDIDSADPTSSIKEYIEKKITNYKSATINWCFMRADDNKNFPSIEYVSSIMPIKYIPYTKTISATTLRSTNNKVGMFNYLLQKVALILKEHEIPFYLDCGTLLGCVRDNEIMQKDTDVDITTHLSMWDKLNNIDFSKYGLERTRTLIGYPEKVDGNMITVKCSKSKLPKKKQLYCDIYTNPAFPLLEEKILNGIMYPIPIKSELYLEKLYGKKWNVPSKKHANCKFHRQNGLMKSNYSPYWDKKYELYKCNERFFGTKGREYFGSKM